MNSQLPKYIFVQLLLTLACATCFAQIHALSPDEGRLNGKIDSVKFMNYKLKTVGTNSVEEFNDKCTYLYNSKGLLIEEHFSDYEGDEPGPFKTVYTYDDQGNPMESLEYKRQGVLKGRAFYTFNPATRVVEVRNARTINGTMLLDKAGNIIEVTNYHDYPTPFSKTVYRYDSNNLCIESLHTWTNSTDVHKTTYTYDARHNLIAEVTLKNETPLVSRTYSYANYDKMGNWLIQNTYEEGRQSWVTRRIVAYRN